MRIIQAGILQQRDGGGIMQLSERLHHLNAQRDIIAFRRGMLVIEFFQSGKIAGERRNGGVPVLFPIPAMQNRCFSVRR